MLMRHPYAVSGEDAGEAVRICLGERSVQLSPLVSLDLNSRLKGIRDVLVNIRIDRIEKCGCRVIRCGNLVLSVNIRQNIRQQTTSSAPASTLAIAANPTPAVSSSAQTSCLVACVSDPQTRPKLQHCLPLDTPQLLLVLRDPPLSITTISLFVIQIPASIFIPWLSADQLRH
jgi:hypothetical protein